jgi:hypothetical protein
LVIINISRILQHHKGLTNELLYDGKHWLSNAKVDRKVLSLITDTQSIDKQEQMAEKEVYLNKYMDSQYRYIETLATVLIT